MSRTEILRAFAATSVHPGLLPSRKDTALSATLAELQRGVQMRSMDDLPLADTVRIASDIHELRVSCGWPIKKRSVGAECRDGRRVVVAEYFLEPDVIKASCARSDGVWVTEVVEERRTLLAGRRPQ